MSVTVSVIVPNYNYGRFLNERLRSLFTQTIDDFEVVVVDDASSDDSREVIECYAADPRLHTVYFDQRSHATYQRWNDGAAQARGRYLLFAGADDSCEPAMLRTLVDTLEERPDAGIAYVRSRVIDAEGHELKLSPSHARWDRDFVSSAAEELPYLLDQKTIPTASAVMIRRELFDRCGGFDTSLTLSADHMLWARVLREANIAYVARPLNHFRTHRSTVRSQSSYADVVRERYRVYGYVLKTFDIAADERERLCERLARKWADCWSQDREPGRLARHRAIARAATEGDPSAVSRLARMLVQRATGIRVRGPRAIARYAWRRFQDERHLLRGRRILWSYSAHYRKARRAYRAAEPETTAPSMRLRALGVHVIGASSPIALPADHAERVNRVAASVDAALSRTEHCKFVPRLSSSPVPAVTGQVAELIEQQLITIQLKNPLALDGLDEISRPLLEAIERQLYGSFVIVDKVYAYRSPVSRQQPRASWIWHFDNHPREVLKVMIYLTDVTDDTAPFEYLRSRTTGRPVMGSPLAPMHHHSRVSPEHVEGLLANGAEIARVTGPRGTVLIFDDNVIHRATLARSSHRDVLVFQIRPATFAARPYISPSWTGSFLHRDVNRDPSDLTPQLRPVEAS